MDGELHMTVKPFQFSGVVVGQTHNPTILNPNFLEGEGIIPKAWNWKVAETITTPLLAMVRYSNGVAVTVEPNKLQVTDPNVEDGLDNCKVREITSAYVGVLRHVRYTAAGNNFQSFIQRDTPNMYLRDRFLKDGPWYRLLDAVGVRLVYPVESGRLTLAIDSGEARPSDEADQQEIIIVNANFSRNCEDNPDYEQVKRFLAKSQEDWSQYQQLLTDILE